MSKDDLRRQILSHFSAPPARLFGNPSAYPAAEHALRVDGQHLSIYGQAGIGKSTLLGYLNRRCFQPHDLHLIATNCVDGQGFSSIWRSVLRRIGSEGMTLDDVAGAAPLTPSGVADALELCEPIVLAFEDLHEAPAQARRELASTLKLISERALPITVIALGRADSVNELFGGGGPLLRGRMQEVALRRWADFDSGLYVQETAREFGFEVSEGALNLVFQYGHGLPGVVRHLTQTALLSAQQDDRSRVSEGDVTAAVLDFAEKPPFGLAAEYNHACSALSEPTQRLRDVLHACAALRVDDFYGWFRRMDVPEKLSQDLSAPYTIHPISMHLNALTKNDGKNSVSTLEKLQDDDGEICYRFRDPMLATYLDAMRFAEKN